MSATLHNFIDIFSNHESHISKIIIPIIQRDYAQGRVDKDITRVRERFLDALYTAVTQAPITLDFIYGDINADGELTPLDGQQRLTTLFLLHWYAAKKGALPQEEYAFLEGFSYETRYSARNFCRELVSFTPEFSETLSVEIRDQHWYPLDWNKDPTIQAMMVMLDAIDRRFCDVEDLWQRLKGGAISFYFLPIQDMGLTDELYIKMNSRGKPLTRFEHFKAELERELKAVDEGLAKRVIEKIDREWTDLLWQYRGADNIIDDEFLRYFRFLCDILCYKKGGTPEGHKQDEFQLLTAYFSPNAPDVRENIAMLEASFDCWCTLPDNNTPQTFLGKYFAEASSPGKVIVDSGRYSLDILADCLRYYPSRQFPLTRVLILYAVLVYLQNQASISEADFIRRLRIVNNLVQNSEDQISNSAQRNRMPADLSQIELIIRDGVIDTSIPQALNVNQLEEEKTKLQWTIEYESLAEQLFRLEDHNLLYGQIGVVGLEHPEYFARFASLMECNRDLVSCALLTFGNYSQQERSDWRYQMGASTNVESWRLLFHRSANSGFEQTKAALQALLSHAERFTDKILTKIKDRFITDCEDSSRYDWRYYFIKYPLFRPNSFGKYSWLDYQGSPYELSVMQTRQYWSENTYSPFLMAIDAKHLSREEKGQRIVWDGWYMKHQNGGYIIFSTETHEEINSVSIQQSSDGIDMEDRIAKMKILYPRIVSTFNNQETQSS